MDVLVVDDNTINGRVYERIVSRLPGCTCRCFNLPYEALSWSMQNAPALVVVDYAMPDIDGIVFVKSFRRIPGRANVPIIMMTAMNDERVRDEARAVGVNLFFTKPVSPDRFLREARALLGTGSKDGNRES